MQITGPLSEVTIQGDPIDGYRLRIVRRREVPVVRFLDEPFNKDITVVLDIARLLAGTTDLSPSTVLFLRSKI